ncbi:hypothetical protein GCM10009647_049380 [Streptomyces sanglieri]
MSPEPLPVLPQADNVAVMPSAVTAAISTRWRNRTAQSVLIHRVARTRHAVVGPCGRGAIVPQPIADGLHQNGYRFRNVTGPVPGRAGPGSMAPPHAYR